MFKDYFLTHYTHQSGAWVKIAEYAGKPGFLLQLKQDLIRRYPQDQARFTLRSRFEYYMH